MSKGAKSMNSAADASRELVATAQAMLSRELPYLEGAFRVLRLRPLVDANLEHEGLFRPFMLIESETDHLPLEAQRQLWQARALAALEPEIELSEEWASSFAPAACQALIAHFELAAVGEIGPDVENGHDFPSE